MRKNHKTPRVTYSPLRNDFIYLFRRFGHKAAYKDGREKTLSKQTMNANQSGMVNILNTLKGLGFKLQKIINLKQKHIYALVRAWEDQGLAPRTIEGKVSKIRIMASWVDKRDMVKHFSLYGKNPAALVVERVPKVAKDWAANGVDAVEKINEVLADNIFFGLVLDLKHTFGLRMREACLFQPHEDVIGAAIHITRGPKGGKPRYLTIREESECDLIEQLREIIPPHGNIITAYVAYMMKYKCRKPGKIMKLDTFKRACYRCCNKHGISRSEGLVPHGLRHERAHLLYKKHTGVNSPLHGGDPSTITHEQSKAARNEVSRNFGHERDSISSAYLGSPPKKSAFKKEDNTKGGMPPHIQLVYVDKRLSE